MNNSIRNIKGIDISKLTILYMLICISTFYIINIYNYQYNINTFMFIIIVPISFFSLIVFKDIFHPFSVFFMTTQFLFIYNMIDLNINKKFFRYGDLQPEKYNYYYFLALIVIFIWYIAMFFSYSLFNIKTKKNVKHLNIDNPVKIAIFLILISLVGFFYTVTLKNGFSGILLALSDRSTAYEGLGYLIKFVGLSSIGAIILLGKGYKKISLIIILSSFFMISIFGGRGAAFFSSIFPYLIYYNYKIKKINIVKLIPFAVLGIFFGLIMGNYRLTQSFNLKFDNIGNILSSIAKSTQGGEILPVLVGSLIEGHIPYSYGKTIINIIFSPIPRGIWPNKPPVDESGIIGRALEGVNSWGLPPGPYGVAFYNFGFIGVIAFGIITGFVIKHVYTQVKNRIQFEGIDLVLVIYTMCITSLFKIVSTSSQIDIVWYLFVFYMILYTDKIFNAFQKDSGKLGVK